MTDSKKPPATASVLDAPVEALIDQLSSEASRKAYRSDWARYTDWLEGEGVGVLEVRPRHVVAHIAFLQKTLEKSTASRALSVIRAIYGALVLDELIATNPAREVKVKKVAYAPKAPVLDEAEVTKLLALPAETWRERRDSLVLHALFGLGWRRSEVAAMRVEHLDGGLVRTVVKGGKPQTFRLPAWLLPMVKEWVRYAGLGEDGALFPRSRDKSSAISGDIVYKIVREAAARADIDSKRVTPHALRRTNITVSGERGVSLKDRQLAVGHASQSTTERYDKAKDASKVAPGDVFADMVKKQDEAGSDPP